MTAQTNTATGDDVTALAIRAKDDPALMEPLWLAVARLVGLWAFRYTLNKRAQGTRLYDADDLIQAGYIALVDAVAGYDTDSNMSFPGYLRYHVRRRFAEVAGRRGTKQRPETSALSLDEPLGEESADSYVDLLPDPAAEFADDVINQYALSQDYADLLAEAEKLPDNLRRALLLTCRDNLTAEAAAEVMGESPRRVHQWRTRAIDKVSVTDAGRRIAAERYNVRRVGLMEFKSTHTSEVEKYILWAEDHPPEAGLYDV